MPYFHRHTGIGDRGIPFGRVSATLQGNFTGSRGLVSNSFLPSALSGEIRHDLVNSFRGKLGTEEEEGRERCLPLGGWVSLSLSLDEIDIELMGKVCHVDRFMGGEIEVCVYIYIRRKRAFLRFITFPVIDFSSSEPLFGTISKDAVK